MKSDTADVTLVTVKITAHLGVEGRLSFPKGAERLVLFAHGSGLLRPDCTHLADIFSRSGIATLLFDLLTPSEANFDEETQIPRHDIVTLGERMVESVIWAQERRELQSLGLGIFADDAGAAAAVIAAVRLPQFVKAVVCRSGQLQAASSMCGYVKAPTLLITGDADDSSASNTEALAALRSTKRLVVIPGVPNLLEDSSRLDEVGKLATEWFRLHLQADVPCSRPLLGDKLNYER
jgi:pimeloyl-ACP methyl ester carboxylesterase